MPSRQLQRFYTRFGFFALFVLAPPLDILRLDLNLKHFIFFGHAWTLGIDGFLRGQDGIGTAALNLFLRGLLPIVALLAVFGWLSWRYGRLYCGWLCPHFSVVEFINDLMRRATGKPTLWERQPLPERQPDGSRIVPNRLYWIPAAAGILGFAWLWALTLLTYLLPPQEIYHNLLHLALTRNQGIFLAVATVAFALEFLLARHLFCRFGCAVGLAQSFVWMANKGAMVVGFDARRGADCAGCDAACDNACPMRLKPRTIKRMKFACTQCGECLSACDQVQADNPRGRLLHWVEDACALQVAGRDFGRRPPVPDDCVFAASRSSEPD